MSRIPSPGLRSQGLRRAVAASLAMAGAAIAPAPASAQTALADATAPGPGAESAVSDIVVTAERRSTSLQKTPLAITAIQADDLDKSNITDVAGLNGLVPGLEITRSSGFETVVTIRGVGLETPENAPITTPGVALFVDGVYVANTVSLDQTLFDVDRIEVLRGPQGALYGQSSTGGAITIITRQPVLNETSGSADVSLGNYSLNRERGEINVPIGDTVAVRLSLQQYAHDGFTRNTSFPNQGLDDANDWSGKLAVLWQPTGNFSATLTGQIYSADQDGAAQKNLNDPNPDPRVVTQDYPARFKLDSQLAHLNLRLDEPWFSVTSVSAYQGLNNRLQEDSSRSAFSILGRYDDVAAWNTQVQNYTEELDILSPPDASPIDWIAGVFLLAQRTTQFVAEFEGSTPNPNLFVAPDIEQHPPSNLAYGNNTIVDRKSVAAFIQATWHVTPDLRLTLGGRLNYDKYDLNSLNFSAFQIAPVAHQYWDHKPTWRAELDYDLSPDNLVYVSTALGYKPGGVNGIASAVVIPNSFQPEENQSYELGSKNFFLDRHLRLNLAGFYYVYKNQQYIETDPVPFDGGIANIPSTHVYGVEGETSYVALGDRLRVNADLSFERGDIGGAYRTIDSTVQNAIEGSNPNCAFGGAFYNPRCWAAVIASARNVGGNQPAKLPEFLGSIDVSYAIPVPTGTLTPRLQYIYRGEQWARIFNEPLLDRVKSYGLWNFNLQYVPNDTNLIVSLAATNLTNVAGVNSRYTDPYGTFQTSQEYIPPFQVVGTVAYSF